jgi:hypothetical protein
LFIVSSSRSFNEVRVPAKSSWVTIPNPEQLCSNGQHTGAITRIQESLFDAQTALITMADLTTTLIAAANAGELVEDVVSC